MAKRRLNTGARKRRAASNEYKETNIIGRASLRAARKGLVRMGFKPFGYKKVSSSRRRRRSR